MGAMAFGGLADRAQRRSQSRVVDRSQVKKMRQLNDSIDQSNHMLCMQNLQKKIFVKCEMQPVWKVEGGYGILQKENGSGPERCEVPATCAFSNAVLTEGAYIRHAPCKCKCAGLVLALREWSQQHPTCPLNQPLVTNAELQEIFGY